MVLLQPRKQRFADRDIDGIARNLRNASVEVHVRANHSGHRYYYWYTGLRKYSSYQLQFSVRLRGESGVLVEWDVD